jgi:hypothetical protein
LTPGKAWVEDKGVRVSNIVTVNYTVIPSFKAAKPDFFKPGIYFGGIYMQYKDPLNIERNAKMFDAAGSAGLFRARKMPTPSGANWASPSSRLNCTSLPTVSVWVPPTAVLKRTNTVIKATRTKTKWNAPPVLRPCMKNVPFS